MELEAEVDLTAAAVAATRGAGVTCTKSATATYTFVFKGNTHGQKMYSVLGREARLNGAPATAFNAIITSVTQATDGSDDITVVAKTTNASLVETANTAGASAATLGICVAIQTARMSGPFD
jgi:hypothetical protein